MISLTTTGSSAQANPLAIDLEDILLQTESLWENLRGKSLFITGGTGFFGCWLLEAFVWANDALDLNASALVLTRDLDGFRRKAPHLAAHPSIRFHHGNIVDFAFPGGEFTHIIHAATTNATATFKNEDRPLTKFDTVVQGTRRTLDFAVQCKAEKFLLTSSGSVYGKQPHDMPFVSEEYAGSPDPLETLSVVPESKRTAELLCALYADEFGIDCSIARCFSFVGPYLPLDLHYAIGNFIRDALTAESIEVRGDGSPIRSYMYAADLMIWLITLLMNGSSGRAYNVGSDEALSIAELACLVRDELAPGKEVRIQLTSDYDACSVSRYAPSIERAKLELNLSVKTPLSEAVRRTAAFAGTRQLA